jgi:GDPmannose 4,6-dehydratase
VFRKLDIDYGDYVVQNEKFMRPDELRYVRGDCAKARTILGWVPDYSFEQLIDDMLGAALAQM